MSYRVNKKAIKGDVKQNECHVCKKNGESWRVYNDHNFRDTKGRICCPIFVKKMRENCCYKCNKVGHFADHCTAVAFKVQEQKPVVVKWPMRSKYVEKETAQSVKARPANVFAALEESSSDEEDKPHLNVTVRKPVSKVAKMDWADMGSDDEDEEPASPRKRLFKMVPCPTCGSSSHMYCHKV